MIDGTCYAAKVPIADKDPQTEEPDPIRNVLSHLKECELISKLRHPNIIKFIRICFLPEFLTLPAMVTEKVPYGNLHKYLEKQGPSNSIELSRKQHIQQCVANGLYTIKSGLRRVRNCVGDLSPGFVAIASEMRECCYGLTTQHWLPCYSVNTQLVV